MDANKKNALVTGANRGLGLEISRQLGRLGMRVWLGVREVAEGQATEAQLRAEGLDVVFVSLDITNPDDVAAAATQVQAHDQRLDVLINNAAIQEMQQSQLPGDIAPQLLRRFVETNFEAHVGVTQAFLPLLKQSPAGRIVNMSTSLGSVTIMSEPGHINARRSLLGYSAAKAALNMFTVLLAKELKETGIKVNSADPGWTRTGLGGPDAPNEVEDSAQVAIWLATLDAQGPTGGFFGNQLVNPW